MMKAYGALCLSLFVAVLFQPAGARAQDPAQREIEIQKNVKLIETEASPELKGELKGEYQRFLPLFEEALKESTANWKTDGSLIVRIAPGIKEIGSAKTKRPIAEVRAHERNSRQEFVGNLLLYSYINQGPVNKEEITQFLDQQILGPMK